jgi:hypothetical protein
MEACYGGTGVMERSCAIYGWRGGKTPTKNRTGTADWDGLVFYSNTGRILIYYPTTYIQAPSAGKLYYWYSRRRRRFGLVAGAPSGRCGHARTV